MFIPECEGTKKEIRTGKYKKKLLGAEKEVPLPRQQAGEKPKTDFILIQLVEIFFLFFQPYFWSAKSEISYLQPQNGNGPVVQLVRMPPCHGGGRGFESRPDRKSPSEMRGFLFSSPAGAV